MKGDDSHNHNNNHNNHKKQQGHKQGQQQKQQQQQQHPMIQQLLESHHATTQAGVAACLVCYAPLTHPGITPCDHNEICALCHLRLRFLHQDHKCPICKAPNELVIVDSFDESEMVRKDNDNIPSLKRFGEYPTAWGDDEDQLYMGDAFVYRGDSVKMFFEKEYYQREIVPIFGFKCHDCSDYNKTDHERDEEDDHDNNNIRRGGKKPKPAVKSSVRALQEHLKTKHGTSLCQLCIDHKRDFVSRLPRFTPPALQQHLRNGDGPHSGFSGHPLCEFCKPTRFYDSHELHRHLQKDHYKCHVCEQQGLDHQYFRDYTSLAKHFERMHFLCTHATCMEIRFVVFANELDYRKHLREVHGEVGGDTKLQLEFRYKSARLVDDQTVPTAQDFQYGLDGQAFVPEVLVASSNNNNNNNSTFSLSDAAGIHPLHLERTAQLRAQAAEVRHAQEAATAFPSLQETVDSTTTPSGGPLQVGWTSSTTLQRVTRHANQGLVNEEDFPSLPAAAPRGPSVHRQFTAIQSAANNPHAAVSFAPTTANWSTQNNATAAMPTTSTRPTTVPTAASTASETPAFIPRNRVEDLAPDNFPALAAPIRPKKAPQVTKRGVVIGGVPVKYNAAEELATRLRQQNLNTASSASFPSLSLAAKAAASNDEASSRKPPPQQLPPSIEDDTAFPPPPSASNPYAALRGTNSNTSTMATGNVLQVPVASAASLQQGKATLEDMKASMGTTRYKKLKALIKEFATDQMAPQAFCEQAVTLFDRGLANPDFWQFIPVLLSSCPNTISAQQAQRYLQEMRVKKTHTIKPAATVVPATAAVAAATSSVAPPPGWTAPPPAVTTAVFEATPPITTSYAKAGGTNSMVGGFGKKPATATKSNAAWGSGNTSSAVLTASKGPAKSGVIAAAAQEGPETGTATKYMAQQLKQQKQQQQMLAASSTANTKKKKEKDELRALAFGK